MIGVSLYLDVDGVVCPYGPVGDTDWGTDWQYATVGRLQVHYAAELVQRLNSLSQHRGVRFVWLTSWEELAPKYLCRAIGLDGRKWPVLVSGEQSRRHDWWKLEAIQGDIDKHTSARAVWIDDQLDGEDAAASWTDEMGWQILGISPDPRRGISRSELSRIEAFIATAAAEKSDHGER